ncbi:MAG: HIT family protein [Zoogloeaceae bacterium]|jgi:diadenosine tetraphosphate (Ap4A) HIT family hydrolase|nr:HIT family protein [Zoogloeaceae bacterium]
MKSCPLCGEPDQAPLWQDALCRLVWVADADYPGFCRVIWKRHVKEMTDLDAAKRRHMMTVVLAAEAALRATVRPDKINLASFGNLVPHLHWHIIPRWRNDRHFPNPIWGETMRQAPPRPPADPAALRAAFLAALG